MFFRNYHPVRVTQQRFRKHRSIAVRSVACISFPGDSGWSREGLGWELAVDGQRKGHLWRWVEKEGLALPGGTGTRISSRSQLESMRGVDRDPDGLHRGAGGVRGRWHSRGGRIRPDAFVGMYAALGDASRHRVHGQQ
jgi:hypothetical protein